MLVQGIKSRPVYKGVAIDKNAARHLFVLEGEGAMTLLEQKSALDQITLGKLEILYVPAASKPKQPGDNLAALGANDYWQAEDVRLQPVIEALPQGEERKDQTTDAQKDADNAAELKLVSNDHDHFPFC